MRWQRWRPYFYGAAIGILSWAVFLVVDKPIGISTGLARAAGGAAMPFVGKQNVLDNAYWSALTPSWDYSTLFLIGTFLGSLLSACLSRQFRWEAVPPLWRSHFGGSVVKRFTASFVGGLLALYGARLADGCTSGHAISGTMQLAVSSWVFLCVMFLSGIVTAQLFFRKEPRDATNNENTPR